jgi:hypothetical protein
MCLHFGHQGNGIDCRIEPCCETIIAGDIKGDCKIDFNDFDLVAAHWLQDNTP